MPLQTVSFDDSLLPQAAQLLALRHSRDRLALPALPPRFSDPQAALDAVTHAFHQPHAAGMALLDGSELVAYLIGALGFDPLRGRHAWISPPGFATAPTTSLDRLRDLYAALGPQWLNHGCFDHYVLAPHSAPSFETPWAYLGFALEQEHGLFDLSQLTPAPPPLPAGLSIRRATPEDAPLLRRMAGWISHYQASAPCWGATLPEDAEELRQGYAELTSEPEWTVWLAFHEEHGVAFQALTPANPADLDLLTPPNTLEMKVAATAPQVRGLGFGKALTDFSLRQARTAGFDWVRSDWRITNLLSSRFWPGRGFRTLARRWVRKVDERILWAH